MAGRGMNLFCFGLGYSAQALGRRLRGLGWEVGGTARSDDGVAALVAAGFDGAAFSGDAPSPEIAAKLTRATHVLISIAPDGEGDPVLRHHGQELRAAAPHLSWIGYLSTIGVYGDHGGAWIDEEAELRPSQQRTEARVAAERDWLQFGEATGAPVHIFRIAGIYGPGRSPLDKVRDGTARRIVKPGQVFNRIHVEDIATVLDASIGRPRAGGIYNLADDEPAPPQDVVAFAAEAINAPPPPEIAFEDADLSPMARSFYGDNKRVRNDRIKRELGVSLRYPTYREGIAALARGEVARG
jgi:nucleoside-diphosphate-sugar epimerase